MGDNFADVLQIKDLIERWVIYRDSLDWDGFRTVWHSDGVMKATWTAGPFEDFIKITDEGVKHGLNILHNLSGSAVEVNGSRAVSITKFVILQRAVVEGVMCDVSCFSKHYDLWEKRAGKWGLVCRETIAEKDRIDPVNPSDKLILDQELLMSYPAEYRHLAYLQTKAGYDVDRDCPRISGGKSLEALYKKGNDWLGAQPRK